jgi:zinc protease
MTRFFADGVDAAELDRIKLQLRASEIYALDNVDGIANRFGQALAIGLTVRDVHDWPQILQSITAEEIVAAGRAVLRPEVSVTGWLEREAEMLQ